MLQAVCEAYRCEECYRWKPSYGEVSFYEGRNKVLQKEETRIAGPWEHGEPPTNQGKRNDLAEIYADVKAQKRLADMVDADPTITKYERHIKMMKMVTGGRQSNRINQQVKVYVFYGGTGLGKTYSAIFLMDDPNNVFKMDPPGKNQQLWFDCYDGERVMVFDEFEEITSAT